MQNIDHLSSIPAKITLVGYMASGKTVIGKKLAKAIQRKFIDLDIYIAEKEKLNISEIFDRKGEVYFRKKELELLETLLKSNDSFVLSVGGGTPCFANAMELINKYSESLYLKANVETLFERLTPKETRLRPKLSCITKDFLKEYLAKHLFERGGYYEKAKRVISVDKLSKTTVVKNILNQLTLNKPD